MKKINGALEIVYPDFSPTIQTAESGTSRAVKITTPYDAKCDLGLPKLETVDGSACLLMHGFDLLK